MTETDQKLHELVKDYISKISALDGGWKISNQKKEELEKRLVGSFKTTYHGPSDSKVPDVAPKMTFGYSLPIGDFGFPAPYPNQIAFEGAQAVARRQADILRVTMEGVQKMTNDMMAVTNPQDRMSKQSEIAKTDFETSLKNMKELADMMAKWNNEAFDLINKSMNEQIEEVKRFVTDTQKKVQEDTPVAKTTSK